MTDIETILSILKGHGIYVGQKWTFKPIDLGEAANEVASILSPPSDAPQSDGAEGLWDIAQSILDKCRCEPIYTDRKMVDPNCAWCEYHVEFIQAMTTHGKNEAAKAVKERDAQINLAEIHITDLEAELAQCKKLIKSRDQRIVDLTQKIHEIRR